MNGVLVVNKPKGFTSRDVVNKVGKILGTKKIGHIGTLDPIATGVLVLCMGNSLKLVELMMEHDKEYIAKVCLGFETDTLDITGNVISKKEVPNLKKEDIELVLKNFLGKISQQVPAYSSVKVHGKKLYEYARNGEDVVLPTREVEIYQLKLINFISSHEFVIKCRVSKGTYIRSLIRDIGYALGTCATMSELERVSLGKFQLSDSYTLDDLEKGHYQLLSNLEALDLPVIVVSDALEKKVRNGQVLPKFFDNDMVYLVNQNHDLLAIYQHKDNDFVKPYRVF